MQFELCRYRWRHSVCQGHIPHVVQISDAAHDSIVQLHVETLGLARSYSSHGPDLRCCVLGLLMGDSQGECSTKLHCDLDSRYR